MPVELLLLLLAWAATLSLIVVVPWTVIRLTVGILEAQQSKPRTDQQDPAQTSARRTIVNRLTPIKQRLTHHHSQADYQHTGTQPVQETKAVVRQFYHAVNAGDIERVDELVASDARTHDPLLAALPDASTSDDPARPVSPAAVSDAEIDIDEMIAEDNMVAVRWTATNTHNRDRTASAPTGTDDEVMGLGLTRVEDGQLTESWGVIDADDTRTLDWRDYMPSRPERDAHG